MGKIWYIEDPAAASAAKTLLSAIAKEKGQELCCADACGAAPAFEKGDSLVFGAAGASKEVVNAILLFVLDGGKILFLGDGMKLKAPHELVLMTAARILREMPYGELTVCVKEDALTEGFGTEDIWDKAMIFERSVFDNADVLIAAVIGRNTYPLVWHHSWYLGEVFCMGTEFYGSGCARYEKVLRNILCAMEV